MRAEVKKYIVLGMLFIFPLVVYLFFASGINNFARLPILTENVPEISHWATLNGSKNQFDGMISIVGFWGSDIELRKGDAFNLNQKIYKRFYQFDDFQFVMAVQAGLEDNVKQILAELQTGSATDLSKWKFIFGTKEQIEDLFKGFKPTLHSMKKPVHLLSLL